MGLNIDVYRSADSESDFSLNGVSARFTRVCVTNIEGSAEPTENCPAVVLIAGPQAGSRGNPILVPVEIIESGEWSMFGGNFGFVSDSRFRNAVDEICSGYSGAVKFHDRVER